jgi:uncharacterized protein
MEPVKDITYFVYTITNISDPANRYVGITKNFKNRMYNHKSNCKNKNQELYKYIRDCGGFQAFDCKVVDTIICTKEQIHELEKEYIAKYKATLNLNISDDKKLERKVWEKNNSTTAYYNSRKEYFTQYQKAYRLRNRERMLEYYRDYRATHKPIKNN